ncbi:EamA-like transporter family protein [Pseudooctadecabacter jejudonensis]|uniref:EamA-like transporter family protein n=2 Tax=Pseudooctadecabacter jejudonensis TaxID=1391910 RepID=A0A1Y5RTJ3_9RHOB|nr:EamA-like transporter family protein [Pseudooctadecabacter jejudonensis]
MTCIVIGDTAGKILTQQGVSPLFVAWTRFALAGLVLLPFMGLQADDLRAVRDPLVWLRALLIAGGIVCILTSLRTEPVANAFGAMFINPIVAFGLAAVFLKERVTVTRSVLLIAGFIGVLLVVKPGFGFTPGLGFALSAGLLYGAFLTTTRAVAQKYRPRLLLISQLLIGSVLLAPMGLSVLPTAISLPMFGFILLSALASAAGNLLVVMASKTSPNTTIAPLIYLQLISATAIGYMVFGDWPDPISFLGLSVIFAAGMSSLALSRR